MGEITGVKTEEVKIDSLKMWKSKKVKIKCEERLLKCEDCEAETPWYPTLDTTKLAQSGIG